MAKNSELAIVPIPRASKPDQIVHQILLKVRRGEWPPGYRLPRQRELAEILNVSMGSLREAIGTLIAMGFLRTVRGKGTFIQGQDSRWIVPDGMAGVYLDRPRSLQDFVEARIALEQTLAALAAQKRSEKDCRAFRRLRRAMQESLGDVEQYKFYDSQLHALVAEATGNSTLTQLYKGLHHLIQTYISAVPDPQRGYEWHVRLVEAILQRDAEGARDAACRSLSVTDEMLEAMDIAWNKRLMPMEDAA